MSSKLLFARRVAIISVFFLLLQPFQEKTSGQLNLSNYIWTPIPGWEGPAGTAITLYNGKVLLVGTGTTRLNSRAEIFDPLTNHRRDTTPMKYPRAGGKLLMLPDGRAIIFGGSENINFPGVPVGIPTEIFDPVTESWSELKFSPTGLKETFIPLNNGKFLIVGFPEVVGTYDPYKDEFKRSRTLPSGLALDVVPPTHSLLPNGEVMFLNLPGKAVAAEIFNPVTETWRTTSVPEIFGVAISGRLTGIRFRGNILAFLDTSRFNIANSSALYDPTTRTWQNLSPRLTNGTQALALSDEEIIVFGEASAEIFSDPPYSGEQPYWRTSDPPSHGANGQKLQLADGRIISMGQTTAEMYGPRRSSDTPLSSVTTNSASFRVVPVANESMISVFDEAYNNAPPGGTLLIKDRSGNVNLARYIAKSGSQINFLIGGIEDGQSEITYSVGNMSYGRGLILKGSVSPGLFTANADGRGIPAAVIQRIKADGTITYEPVARFDSSQSAFVAESIRTGDSTDQVFLVLFATGLRNRSSLSNVQVYIGDLPCEVLYAGKQPQFEGLDQVNIRIPRTLAGRGEVRLLMAVDGKDANPVTLRFE